MMDAKELALATAFAKAPQEIQDAANASSALYKKIAKNKDQISALTEETFQLELQVGAADKTLRKLIDAWDGAASTVKAADTKASKA